MPKCTIQYPTKLSFSGGSSLSFSVYKDPLTGKIITNGGSETINASIAFTYRYRGALGKWYDQVINITQFPSYSWGSVWGKYVYLESGASKIVSLNKFASVNLSDLGFKTASYTLKYKGDTFVTGGSCLTDVENGGTLSLVAQKFKTRMVFEESLPSSLTVYKDTNNKFVLVGGSDSIKVSPKIQYSNISGQWVDLPGAKAQISSNSGKKFTSDSISLSSLTTSDTNISISYGGSDSLSPCSQSVSLSYVLKLPTRISFTDSSTVFMGKRSRTSASSTTTDLKDISVGARMAFDVTPTPSPTKTPNPTSTPSATPTQRPPTPTPTSTPTLTPPPGWSQNYENQLGLNLASWLTTDLCGWSIAMNTLGNRAIIGCPMGWFGSTLSAKSPQGYVRCFALINNSWKQIGPDILGERNLDSFGHSVSMNETGNIVAIGAIKNDGQSGLMSNSGAVYVYQFDGIKWNKLGNTIYGNNADDQCGYSVTLNPSGNRIVVGFNQADSGGIINSGLARVYSYNESNKTWTQVGNNITGLNITDQKLGWSVSLNNNGDTIAIGQVRNNGIGGVGVATGHAKVFKLTNQGLSQVWNQLGLDLDIDEESENSNYGGSVSLNSIGNRLAVGAYSAVPANQNEKRGHVKIYEYNGNAWSLIGTINGVHGGEAFGYSVSLDGAGNRVAIGAIGSNNGNKQSAGSLSVYEYKSFNNWTKVGKSIFGNSAGLSLGSSVFISKDSKRVGVGSLSGGAAIYRLEEVQPISPTSTPAPTPTPTLAPTPTPTPTITATPQPTPTLIAIVNEGNSYSVADFSVKLEAFDPKSNNWINLTDAVSLYSNSLPNRLLSVNSSMPLTTAQIDPNNIIAGGGFLQFTCSYAGHSNYAPCVSSEKKKIQYVNNFISSSLPQCSSSSKTDASYTKTYSLQGLSGYSGSWNLPSDSIILAKSNTIGKTLYPSSFNLTQAPYYPNFNKVLLNGAKNSIVVYQPCNDIKIPGQAPGVELSFYQDFELDYIHNNKKLRMNVRLNLAKVKN
jgi:hypothetical protein